MINFIDFSDKINIFFKKIERKKLVVRWRQSMLELHHDFAGAPLSHYTGFIGNTHDLAKVTILRL